MTRSHPGGLRCAAVPPEVLVTPVTGTRGPSCSLMRITEGSVLDDAVIGVTVTPTAARPCADCFDPVLGDGLPVRG